MNFVNNYFKNKGNDALGREHGHFIILIVVINLFNNLPALLKIVLAEEA